ncbi:small ribosomal subunit Rsm22 family protein [Streptomyces sp. JJ36]|uniref:small ribosomal subunit Rsm22 family protein n=1 Tax=Streptomyces sp. JJ36 TaxID=2736645 RepID=UPI001F398F33|nr:small ribosomal subunit Rsm22 family protein [Streptomyces sp. JJ36]MCF6521856.1 rRNA methyltransferase [Streptomyces sp. JJ36]
MHHPTSPAPAGERLRQSLGALVDGLPPRRAAAAVDRLIAHYRGTSTDAGVITGTAPILRDRADVVAYAAYRMPATFAAAAAALGALATRLPGWSPAVHLDVGGGTGTAVWAAEAVWGDGPGGATRATTVLDRSEPALALGGELAAASGGPALRAAAWRCARLTGGHGAGASGGAGDVRTSGHGGATGDGPAPALPPADLVTASYLLGELPADDRRALVTATARAGDAVVLIEPGTPDGYLRIREARDQLTEAGLTVLAPCPHSARCPIVPGEDWCHVAARVARSSVHRQVKGGSLPYEDEKFSYVAAVAPALTADGAPAPSRVVRKPQLRKGQVLLDLCTREDGLRRTTVSKRQGPRYRAARDTSWGDAWPPEGEGA